MSPATLLLADLQRRGVQLEARGAQLHVEAPRGVLTADDKDRLRQLKPDLLRLLMPPRPAWPPQPELLPAHPRQIGAFTPCEGCGRGTWATYNSVALCLRCAERRGAALLAYRDALREVWRIMRAGGEADPETCRRVLDEVAKLIDDVGEPLATGLRRRWEHEWWRETGRCPRCGEPGTSHLSDCDEP